MPVLLVASESSCQYTLYHHDHHLRFSMQICDFGLARMHDPYEEAHLTQEVVTQYYRSPELLMEATRYSYAVDIWSAGCTVAELLGRRILFPVGIERNYLYVDI